MRTQAACALSLDCILVAVDYRVAPQAPAPGAAEDGFLAYSYLTGHASELGDGGERVLQDLEQAGAFVVSLDAERSWFRYHQMFADLLLELRRTAPGEVTGLHAVASGWFARHGYPAEAIRHAQAARDWGLAARLLAAHWPGLHLDGQDATIHELPADLLPTDAQLAVIAALRQLQLPIMRAPPHLRFVWQKPR